MQENTKEYSGAIRGCRRVGILVADHWGVIVVGHISAAYLLPSPTFGMSPVIGALIPTLMVVFLPRLHALVEKQSARTQDAMKR